MPVIQFKSYHINIGAGDSAIHILYRDNGLFAGKEVLRAVFLDGGPAPGVKGLPGFKGITTFEIPKMITRTIIEIENTYICTGDEIPNDPRKRRYLQFDAFIVSHWDVDHFQGLRNFLAGQLRLAGNTPHPNRLARAKYDVNTGNPLSCFYAPHWKLTPKMANPQNITEENEQDKDFPSKECEIFEVGSANEKKLEFWDYLDMKDENKKPQKKVLQIAIGTGFLLGRDFLKPAGTHPQMPLSTNLISNPQLLLETNPPAADGLPGMYCVAVNKKVLGPDIKALTTTKNKSSICTLLLWPNGDGTHNASHYSGGDAAIDTEKKIIQWTGYDGRKDNENSVTTVKLSHHGAVSSNPLGMFVLWNPINIIGSAGSGNHYGHPRWEVLVMIEAWLWSRMPHKRGYDPLYLLNEPNWLEPDPNEIFDFNVKDISDAGFDATDKNSAYSLVKALIDSASEILIKKGFNVLTCWLNKYDAWLEKQGGASAEQKIEWMCWYIQETMSSYTGYVGYKANYKFGKSGETQYLVTTSAASEQQGDGGIGVKHEKEDFEMVLTDWRGKSKWKSFAAPWKTNLQHSSHKRSATLDSLTSWDQLSDSDLEDGEETFKDPSRSISPYGRFALTGNEAYLFSDKLVERPPGPNAFAIPAKSLLSSFVDVLRWRAFMVQEVPAVDKSVELWTSDDWQLWFTAVFESFKGVFGFVASVWPLDDQVSSFSFVLELKLGSAQVRMSTKSAAAALGVEQKSIDSLLEKGTLVFGLQTTPNLPEIETDLNTVANLIHFQFQEEIRIIGDMKLYLNTMDKQRNAVWFSSQQGYMTSLRLCFQTKPEAVTSWLSRVVPSLDIKSINVIAKMTASNQPSVHGDTAIFVGSFTIVLMGAIQPPNNSKPLSFQASMEILPSMIKLRIQFNGTVAQNYSTDDADSPLKSILSWLMQSVGLPALNVEDLLQTADSLLKYIKPRVVELTLGIDKDGHLTAPTSVLIRLQVSITTKGENETETQPLIFMLDFNWTKSKGPAFEGSVWSNPRYPDLARLLPDWEDYLDLQPILENGQTGHVDNLNLAKLFGIKNFPSGIPADVAKASIQIDKEHALFQGTLYCGEPAKKGDAPKFQLDELSLMAKYTWPPKGGKGAIALGLGLNMTLYPVALKSLGEFYEYENLETARLRGMVMYNDGDWQVNAGVYNVTVQHLRGFWDPSTQAAVSDVLGNLQIDYLELDYYYEKGDNGAGKSFLFKGAISFGSFLLDVEFRNEKAKWTFTIGLLDKQTKNDGKCTLGRLLKEILGETPKLPTVILDISLETAGEKDLLRFTCSEMTIGSTTCLVLLGSIHFKSFTFTFVQYRDKSWPKGTASKRIIKASISEIGPVEAPLVGQLKQPFDQLYYMWVSDETQKSDKKGITYSEFTALNGTERITAGDQLYMRNLKAKYEPTDVVIQAGSHFTIVAKDSKGESSAVLDYVFGKPESTKKQLEADYDELDDWDYVSIVADESKPGASKDVAPFKKSAGPLSIENIGLKYNADEGKLAVILDATFMLGPVGLSLLGFGLQFPLPLGEKKQTTQPQFDLSDIEVVLSGLAVSFERPPLTVAGGFQRREDGDFVFYAGGLIVGFKPWNIKAMGVYSKYPTKPNPAKKPFTMVLIILKVEGPLLSLGWADISGVTGGFGVNSALTLPTLDTVLQHPFVSSSDVDPDGSPIQQLNGLMAQNWFAPREGSFWVAVGMKATAFQMLSVDAVAVFEFNPGIRLGIYGVAVFDAPSLKSPVKFAHAELGLVCVLDIEAGFFKVEAQLSPNSFILHPSCHLTGGFAIYSWFKDNPRTQAIAGDWVMTVGGYHQAFNVPTQYPKPPRLGISWSLDSALSITGEAYFAITPKVCMGGGRLHASLSLGPLQAFFDAFVDFLINYNPFHFSALGKISVGVRFTLDLWLVTIRINVEIGAMLAIEGPPMAGTVHVDFWVFGFDIKFGAQPTKPPRLTLKKFIAMVFELEDKPAAAALALARLGTVSGEDDKAKKKTTQPIIFNCTQGMIPQDDKKKASQAENGDVPKKEEPWVVRGGELEFSISFKFPISYLKLEDKREAHPIGKPPQEISMPEDGIYALPMERRQKLNSKVTLVISQSIDEMEILREPPLRPPEQWEWKIERELKIVQRSIWARYDSELDPSVATSNKDVKTRKILDNREKSPVLVTGVIISPPRPELSADVIPKFNMASDMQQSIYAAKDIPPLPTRDPSRRAWTPRLPKDMDWNTVKKVWQDENNKPEKVVDLWAKRLGFEGKISGKRPAALLSRFSNMVPALPAVAVGKA